jgi:hypothetical protein
MMFDSQEGEVIKSAFLNIKLIESASLSQAMSSKESSRGFNNRKNLEGIGRIVEARTEEAEIEDADSRERSTELLFNLQMLEAFNNDVFNTKVGKAMFEKSLLEEDKQS